MVEACVAEFGGVDKLVANAGIVHFASVTDTTVDDFDRVIGSTCAARGCAPNMRRPR